MGGFGGRFRVERRGLERVDGTISGPGGGRKGERAPKGVFQFSKICTRVCASSTLHNGDGDEINLTTHWRETYLSKSFYVVALRARARACVCAYDTPETLS